MKNQTTLFLLLTFTISWTLAGILYLTGWKFNTIPATLFAVAYMFVPMVCAIIVSKMHKENIKKTLGISFKFNRWYLIAWLIFPLISIAAFGVSLLFPDISYSPEMEGMFERFRTTMTAEQMAQMKKTIEDLPIHPFWLTMFQGMFAGLTLNAMAGFGEESGWRGFLLYRFRNMNFWKASLLIGLIWGIWHAPLVYQGHNYPHHPYSGIVMMTVWCMLLSPIFIYITIKSKSVLAAAIAHGTLNGTAGLAMLLTKGGSDFTIGVTGLPGFIVLSLVLIFLIIYDRFFVKDKLTSGTIGNHYFLRDEKSNIVYSNEP